MKKLYLLLLVLYSAAIGAQTPLTAELMWQFKRIREPQVSPDGKWLIYSARSYSIKDSKSAGVLYLYDLEKTAATVFSQ